MARDLNGFPMREVLAGELRGKSEAEVVEFCGPPHGRIGASVLVYEFKGEEIPPGSLGSPDTVNVQLLLGGDDFSERVEHVWLRMGYADGLDYQEVIH